MKITIDGLKKVLGPKELKNIKGGSGCGNLGLGTCGYRSGDGSFCACGIPQAEAQAEASLYNGYWCCDSCGSTGYCG